MSLHVVPSTGYSRMNVRVVIQEPPATLVNDGHEAVILCSKTINFKLLKGKYINSLEGQTFLLGFFSFISQ